jgi:hypothetical protein
MTRLEGRSLFPSKQKISWQKQGKAVKMTGAETCKPQDVKILHDLVK